MRIAVGILAKDEAPRIGGAIAQLIDQSLLRNRGGDLTIHIVSNGSRDGTASSALAQQPAVEATGAKLLVHDLPRPGKSRAWNRTVHEFVDPATEILIFLDADVTLARADVLEKLLDQLERHPNAAVCTGYPVKDIQTKAKKSIVDRFSLAISRESRAAGAINGSLYAARFSPLRDMWLPDETPGEDGFLNAMITTQGFSRPYDPAQVCTVDEPTHFFKAHDRKNFFAHERRMIVGTVINCWVFEYLWELGATEPVGPRIAEWNQADPHWVERIIRARADNRNWIVPSSIVFGRLAGRGGLFRRMAHLPVGIAATLLTLPPALLANRRLKQIGAASTW